VGPLYCVFLIVIFYARCFPTVERLHTNIGVHDHGGIVWDEFVGYWNHYVPRRRQGGYGCIGCNYSRFLTFLKPCQFVGSIKMSAVVWKVMMRRCILARFDGIGLSYKFCAYNIN